MHQSYRLFIYLTGIQASARENAKSLGYEDVRSLDHFLTSVQRKFERSIRIHGDNIGKYMKQGCLTDNGSTDGVDDAPNKNFLFLSLHFYQLATHVYRPGNLKHDAHFPSTLLQNKYPHATKQRDLNQAVCSLESTLDGQCFYTPNFWCLMVDDCKSSDHNSMLLYNHLLIVRPYVDMGGRELCARRVWRCCKTAKIYASYTTN